MTTTTNFCRNTKAASGICEGAAGVPPAETWQGWKNLFSCRQDAALYGSQDGRYVFRAPTRNGPGARDLSRRNAGTGDPRWDISRPFCSPTFLRTKVRAPFARAATTLNRHEASCYRRKPTLSGYDAGSTPKRTLERP